MTRPRPHTAALPIASALFCAIPFFRGAASLDPEAERRRLRTASALTILSPLHVLFPITALGIVRDARQLADKPEQHATTRQRLRLAGLVGITVSVVAFVVFAGMGEQ